VRTAGRTILINLGQNDLGRPGPASKSSQIEGVHITGKYQIIQISQTAIGRQRPEHILLPPISVVLTKAYAILPSVHSAGLGDQRDLVPVLVTNHSKNELLEITLERSAVSYYT
jgi:hypothetical protein